MGQCQLMLENNEKNNKKILYLLNLKICSKDAALISFILNIKKDFDYLSFTSQWHNNSARLGSGLQLFFSLLPAFPNNNFMSVLPQITYGNMALIFLSFPWIQQK
jgi:hypothetical protein